MKGIVRVPEWAKEAFRNGAQSVEIDDVFVLSPMLDFDGEEAFFSDCVLWIVPKDENSHSFPPSWIEPIEEPIDWERVEVDASIQVFCNGKSEWANAHFAKVGTGGEVAVWIDGKTSHTTANLNWSVIEARFPEGVNPEDHYKD